MDDDLLAVGVPGAVAEHGVDPEHAVLVPYVDPAGPPHGDLGRVVQLVPTQGVGRVGQRARVRRVLADVEMEPSLSSALDPSRKPEQMSRMTRCGALAIRSRSRGRVRPAEVDEAGDQRGPGQVVEQQVQRRAARDLVGELLGDGGRAGPPRPASDEPLQTSAARDRPRCAGCHARARSPRRGPRGPGPRARRLGGVSRSRARPFRWRSVPSPSGQNISTVEVRRTEPGRRTGGATAGSEGGGAQRRHHPPPFSQTMFSLYAGPKATRAPFRTTLLTKAQVKSGLSRTPTR